MLGVMAPVEASIVNPVAENVPPVYTPVPVIVGAWEIAMSLQNGDPL